MKQMILVLVGMGLLSLEAPPHAFAGESKPALKVLVELGTQKGGSTVKFTLVNDSSNYQLVQSMSCSWQDYWTTDDKHALLEVSECGKNALFTVILAPGEKHVEQTHLLALRGTPGKHKLRFGYVRPISTFTNTELKKLYASQGRNGSFYDTSFFSHFKAGAARETFWSAPITVEVRSPSLP